MSLLSLANSMLKYFGLTLAFASVFTVNGADNEKIDELLKSRNRYSAECNMLVDILSDVIKFSCITDSSIDELNLDSLKVHALSEGSTCQEKIEIQTNKLKNFSNILLESIAEAKVYHDEYLLDSLPSVKDSRFVYFLRTLRVDIED